MRRLLILALAALVAFAAPAAAQVTLDEVMQDIDDFGYYIEPGVSVDFDALDTAIASLGDDVVLVVLQEDDPQALDQVENALGANDRRSVIVVSGDFVEAVGDHPSADIDVAIDAFDLALSRGEGYGVALADFQATLDAVTGDASPAEAPATTSAATGDSSSGGGGGGGFIIFLLVIVAIVGGLIFFARRKGKQVDDGEVERARAEIRSQLALVATEILEHETEVEVRGDDQAIAYFREANATYTEVSEAVEETTNLLELAELNDEVDEARWQLEAAEAIMEGRPIPPEPEPEKPTACFFDPTHKPGTEECTLKTEAGNKEVLVCRSCAAKLERGEEPAPRMIDVGGRRVPSATAPRSHGGLGMGGLRAFEVILGGLGALAGARGGGGRSSSRSGGMGIDWGGRLPSRTPSSSRRQPAPSPSRSTQRLPSRPRGLPRSPASRPPRSPQRRSGATGRGRARRRRRG